MGALIEVNTDGLAKLAETIGSWFGWNVRAIELNAEAEAYATVRKVDAENAANLARLQGEEQVANYIIAREKRKMENAKSIVKLARSQMVEGEKVSSEPVNEDWINRFFSIVEEVSDFEMQKLWSQILAGEVKRPKSYSLRTLEVLRNMTKEEADLFVKATSYMVDDDAIINEVDMSLSVEELLTLNDIGLVNNENLAVTYDIEKASIPYPIVIDKHNVLAIYNPDIVGLKLSVGIRSLTIAGKELAKLVDRHTSNDIFQYMADKCKTYNCKIVTKHNITGYLPSGQCLYSKTGEVLYKREE